MNFIVLNHSNPLSLDIFTCDKFYYIYFMLLSNLHLYLTSLIMLATYLPFPGDSQNLPLSNETYRTSTIESLGFTILGQFNSVFKICYQL